MQHLINIHFFSEKLGRLAANRPGMLYFVFNAEVVMVLVAHTIRNGEFVAQVPLAVVKAFSLCTLIHLTSSSTKVPYFPPLQSPKDFDGAQCLKVIQAASGLGTGLDDVRLEQVRPWTMSAQVADR